MQRQAAEGQPVLGAFEMHSRTRGRSWWSYLQWLLWAPSGGQNPGILSEPRGSGQHPQSWGGCWSGQLAESHCRRWYNSRWLYGDCSPKSTTGKGYQWVSVTFRQSQFSPLRTDYVGFLNLIFIITKKLQQWKRLSVTEFTCAKQYFINITPISLHIHDMTIQSILLSLPFYKWRNKNTGVCSHSLLQGIFPTWVDLSLLHCRQILYHLSHQGSP